MVQCTEHLLGATVAISRARLRGAFLAIEGVLAHVLLARDNRTQDDNERARRPAATLPERRESVAADLQLPSQGVLGDAPPTQVVHVVARELLEVPHRIQ